MSSAMNFELRNVRESDFDWLYYLRSQTMLTYINDSGGRFDLESQSGRITLAYDSIKIVTSGNQDIGMFKVTRGSDNWEIVQIQILPDYQHMGIGTELIRNLQEEASQQGITLSLSVLKVNPAKRLYERLGFEVVQEKEKSYTMRYTSKSA